MINKLGNDEVAVWVPDNGDGTYNNPVIHADYSDPDVIRVDEDYFMVSSSFNNIPGLPILHSRDLVHWELTAHALQEQLPADIFDTVQHGNGVWAPTIRYHNNIFHIFYPDPEHGIFVTRSAVITGPWTVPALVQAGRGLIDPCPLWDTDGKVYLIHAYEGSRAGIKGILVIKEMNGYADKITGPAVIVYDGHETDPVVEGPKIYKRNNYYYIFAPAGGVPSGWQIVLRSENIYGPYERKIVLQQGGTQVNGPHQGAWIETSQQENWFIHFQDKYAYGRVVHLEPMYWKDDWPVIGKLNKQTGIGEPVLHHKKPLVNIPVKGGAPAMLDDFEGSPGLQWQWPANAQPEWMALHPGGGLRLVCIATAHGAKNRWMQPNLLLQKFPAESFTVTTKIAFEPAHLHDRVGCMVFGTDYAFLSLVKTAEGNYLTYNHCFSADQGHVEHERKLMKTKAGSIYFKVCVLPGAGCYFSYSEDGEHFTQVDAAFEAKAGKWVGARIGLFATGDAAAGAPGFADIAWFRFSR